MTKYGQQHELLSSVIANKTACKQQSLYLNVNQAIALPDYVKSLESSHGQSLIKKTSGSVMQKHRSEIIYEHSSATTLIKRAEILRQKYMVIKLNLINTRPWPKKSHKGKSTCGRRNGI